MAQRNQKNRRPHHKKKKPHLEKSARQMLVRRMQQSEYFGQKTILFDPPGMVKTSEVFLEFAKPYLDLSNEERYKRRIISMAIIAWNLAVAPELDQGALFLNLAARKTPEPHDFNVLRRFLDEMIERKRQFFVEHNRIILDYQISGFPNNLHLIVMSMAVDQLRSQAST